MPMHAKYTSPAKDAPLCDGHAVARSFNGDTAECTCGSRVPVWAGKLIGHEARKKDR